MEEPVVIDRLVSKPSTGRRAALRIKSRLSRFELFRPIDGV